MAELITPTKRLAISKANTQAVIVTAIASFITVFCLVASYTVWKQTKYQSNVISAAQHSKQQLSTDISAYKDLSTSYNSFENGATNIIGGSSSLTAPVPPNAAYDNNGPNSKLILDALPSSYDFPALATSVERILEAGNFDISAITGTDNELGEETNTASPNPTPVQMPFGLSVINTNYEAVQQLVQTLQNSIRPLSVDQLDITGGGTTMLLTINGHSYYLPGKTLTITEQAVQ